MEEVVVWPDSPEERIKRQEKRVCKVLKLLLDTYTCDWDEKDSEFAFMAMEGAHTLISYFESLPRKRANLDTPNAHRSRWSASKGRLRKALYEFNWCMSPEGYMLHLHKLPGRMVMGGDYKGALILDFDAKEMAEKREMKYDEESAGGRTKAYDVWVRSNPFIIPALFQGEEVQLELAELPGMDEFYSCTHALPDGPMGVWAVFRKVE